MQIRIHILLRTNLAEHLAGYKLMVLQDILQRVRIQLNVSLQIQVLTQRESAQVIYLHDAYQFFVLLTFQIHDR